MKADSALNRSTMEAYRGRWIVVDRDWQRVIAVADDPKECARQAHEAGKDQIVYVYRVPDIADAPPAGIALDLAPSPVTPSP